MIYVGRRRYGREDFAVIGRHLHGKEASFAAAHDIKSDAHARRELFGVVASPFFGHSYLSFLAAIISRKGKRRGGMALSTESSVVGDHAPQGQNIALLASKTPAVSIEFPRAAGLRSSDNPVASGTTTGTGADTKPVASAS
jgi:hypothetical protein